jgi:hypothetical protein
LPPARLHITLSGVYEWARTLVRAFYGANALIKWFQHSVLVRLYSAGG